MLLKSESIIQPLSLEILLETQTDLDSLPPVPSTQLRHGGDVKGLVHDRTLDYLELMGIKVLYISGSITL